MLKELIIRDFKLLRDISIDFSGGMSVFTGETGAGKTQCLQALMTAIGARSGDDAISADSDRAVITAIFDISSRVDIASDLRVNGWIDDETELILERTVSRNGASTGRLNGRRVPIKTLQEIGEKLVDILGQNARADILNRSALDILDSFGDSGHSNDVRDVRDLFASWKNSLQILEAEREEITRAEERRELAQFQFGELDRANLSAGEEDSLTTELKLLSDARQRIEAASQAVEILTGESDEKSSARDLLVETLGRLEILADSDKSLEPDLNRLRDVIYTAEELGDTLQKYAENVIDDPARRDEVEERIALIHGLKRKYKTGETGLIELRDQLRAELEKVASASERLRQLVKNCVESREKYLESALQLSKTRSSLAKRISKEVKLHLKDLDLPDANFFAELNTIDDENSYRSDGIDRAELMITTNRAQSPGPLKKVASGGELSRLLIALKMVLSKRDRVPVLVFDEAEAGIGGETAFRVGEKIAELSKSHQLIIVSHLPQIASQADEHWVIEKSRNGKGTQAKARKVKGNERVDEIKRMLGGRGDEKALEKLARSILNP